MLNEPSKSTISIPASPYKNPRKPSLLAYLLSPHSIRVALPRTRHGPPAFLGCAAALPDLGLSAKAPRQGKDLREPGQQPKKTQTPSKGHTMSDGTGLLLQGEALSKFALN